MAKWSLDLETFSEANLGAVGAWAYAHHPSTEVICAAYARDDEPARVWLPGKKRPAFSRDVKGEIHAFNSYFEYVIWLAQMQDVWGPVPPIEQWHDTAAKVAALALPRALGNATKALRLPADEQKDAEGKKLIKLLCMPQKDGSRNRDPKALKKLYRYCAQDVVAERAVSRKVLDLTPFEREVWLADQRINLRGLPVDTDSVDAALDLLDDCDEYIKDEVTRITNGQLDNIGSPLQVQEYFQDEFDIVLENCQKQYLLDTIATLDDGPPKRLLELRLAAAKASTKKYAKLQQMASHDGRAHGVLMYHGAQPGRWAGRGFQPQNLPRPAFDDTDECAELFLMRDLGIIESLYGEPMTALASCIRSMIQAKPGHHLLVGDYSAVESRGLGWQAGQTDKLEVFRTTGKVYEHQAGLIFGLDPATITKGSWERQLGKVADLALGFQGGWRAFVRMGANYGIDMEQVVLKATDEQRARFKDIKEFWFKVNHNIGFRAELNELQQRQAAEQMTDGEAFADLIKRNWREANAAIVHYWDEVLRAALLAVANPGKAYKIGKVKFKYFKKAGFLLCFLPSGRPIAYANPKEDVDPERGTPVLRFAGVDDKGNWKRHVTWGGKLVQNITEGICRDLMAFAIVNLEKAGYSAVLSVHDEVVAEVRNGHGSLKEFVTIMENKPAWAKGFPLAVGDDAYKAMRYRK